MSAKPLVAKAGCVRPGALDADMIYNNLARFRVNAARGFEFSHSFKTDGVSVRLLYERAQYSRSRTRVKVYRNVVSTLSTH